MSRRPGEASMAGCTSCVTLVFFIPFAAVGLGILREGWRLYFNKHQLGPALFMGGIGLLFSAIGLGGICWALTSILNRRKANGPMKKTKPIPPGWRQNPWFPDLPGRGTSPHGRIGITPRSSNWGMFIGLLIFSLIWNGLTWAAVIAMFAKKNESKGPLIFLSLFVLVGLGVLYAAFKQLLRILLVGDTTAELDAEPLAPGEQGRVSLYQKGDFRAEQMSVSLVAQERVTYGSGTNQTTHTETVHEEQIFSQPDVAISRDHAIAQVEFRVPEDAAPSFKSTNNELSWSIRVRMTIAGRPDVDQYFPFRVSPEFEANA